MGKTIKKVGGGLLAAAGIVAAPFTGGTSLALVAPGVKLASSPSTKKTAAANAAAISAAIPKQAPTIVNTPAPTIEAPPVEEPVPLVDVNNPIEVERRRKRAAIRRRQSGGTSSTILSENKGDKLGG